MEKRETRVSAVKPTKRQTAKGRIPAIEDLTVKQTKDAYCPEPTTQVGMSSSRFQADHNGLLVRTWQIDDCLQKEVPVSLTDQMLHVEHHPPFAGHRGERRMYRPIRKKIFWFHFANEACQTVSTCATCPRNLEQTKRKRQYHLFPAAGPLQSIAIDILGSLPQTKNENVFIIGMTD